MLKIEYIWRDLLYQGVEEKNPDFTITGLSIKFKLSTSMVSHALNPLRQLNMVKIGKNTSKIIDIEKLLFFWATRRKIEKEIIYKTYNSLPVFERENLMPAEVIPTAYSAFHFLFKDLPADYENIYFYADDTAEIKKRFPENGRKEPNIFILRKDPYLKSYKQIPLAQIFVDLWNLPEWYAKEFQDNVLLKIKEKIGL